MILRSDRQVPGPGGPRTMRSAPSAGFTLIEILVVLTILAVVSVTIAMAWPQRGGRLDVASAADSVASGLRLARARAIAFAMPVGFALDPDGHGFVLGGEHHGLPAQVRAVMTGPPVIRFDPLGGANGGLVRIIGRGDALLVRVDRLTGRVTSGAGA